MVYGYPDYQSELGNINLRIESCETGIRMNERKIRKLREALEVIVDENKELGEYADNFIGNLCHVKDWHSTAYYEYSDEVKRVKRQVDDYRREVNNAIRKIKTKIEELEGEVKKKENEIKSLTSQQSKLRVKLREERALKNPCGSGTY